jgi:signal transduction histidine kinase
MELAELPMVVCDARKIKRLVLNLVSNAAKFTSQGKIKVTMSPTTAIQVR